MARANLPRVVLIENNIYPNFGLIGYLSFSVLSNYTYVQLYYRYTACSTLLPASCVSSHSYVRRDPTYGCSGTAEEQIADTV